MLSDWLFSLATLPGLVTVYGDNDPEWPGMVWFLPMKSAVMISRVWSSIVGCLGKIAVVGGVRCECRHVIIYGVHSICRFIP